MRKGRAPKRHIAPDIKYNSVAASKFINYLMLRGQKETARNIFYKALDIVGQKSEKDGFEVWQEAVNNVSPAVELKGRRMGSSNIQIPIEVRPVRSQFMGMNWIIRFARKRPSKRMEVCLAAELLAAANEEGNAYKKKEEVHKMAAANRAFSHLRR